MEMLDIYDAAGERTDRSAPRGTRLSQGEYFLCTHIFLKNQDGRFLIQQRSAIKPTRPNVWDITAGAVDAGETSLEAAIRETKEEVGLTITPASLHFLFRDCVRSCYHDVYYACVPFTLSDCTMQASEVQALRLVTRAELLELVKAMPHRSDNYKEKVTKFLLDQE